MKTATPKKNRMKSSAVQPREALAMRQHELAEVTAMVLNLKQAGVVFNDAEFHEALSAALEAAKYDVEIKCYEYANAAMAERAHVASDE